MGINRSLIEQISYASQNSEAIAASHRLTVTTDSRRGEQNSLFVPLVGERFDGHDHLLSAIDNGAVATLWQRDKALSKEVPADFPIFYVEDTLQALQELAHLYRKAIDPTVIAITGSNGKTTTKDMVASTLEATFKLHKTEGNLNNHIGVPLTLLAMPEDCEVCVLEMGMNHFGEIALLSRIAEPDIGLITNIGESHIEFLGSREGIAKAKSEIIEGMSPDGLLIVDGDEPLLDALRHERVNAVLCGYGEANDFVISDAKGNQEGSAFKVNGKSYTIPLLGAHNVKNAAYAIAVANHLKLSGERIFARLKALKHTAMRLECVAGKAGTLIINDAYNASPTSMKAAIETIKALSDFPNKVIVLGDMYELGPDEEALHREVASVISAPITHVVTLGERAQWIFEACQQEQHPSITLKHFSSKDKVLAYLQTFLSEDTVMLFKASRLAGLEALVERLKNEEDQR
ncbi:UDP-N-acetylmuramoyl-tripeptide--D-alanyl-D-alanine ligase [Pullulanibacillus camelliae]|uniref:UDP-N-acetylmuramoyl-tripeptide--D-alanyl-D-alanine ligase n=1 Tax=Pullulanibacillus camelliae TaxID=1707096 RepID=A0A8J2VNT8_9BACL|nr:UDP-N-acetylmuramoyl-tripeptide--D-alanyl-D-alanine ligase [Pullulanibacillus camelliae]GGE41342.1 UDP-N-acetylmuramoyl-tripeptide--D-alanyl-D-alanine ligase [Pullulanibacillus camelliae]